MSGQIDVMIDDLSENALINGDWTRTFSSAPSVLSGYS